MKRFEDSKVGRIGRRDAQSMGHQPIRRDLYVVWEIYESGVPARLAYRHRDMPVLMQGASLAKKPDTLPMKLSESRPERGSDEPAARGNVQYVPDEFVPSAVALHQQMWGQQPQTERVNDVPKKSEPVSNPKTEDKPKVPDVFNVDPRTGKKFGP